MATGPLPADTAAGVPPPARLWRWGLWALAGLLLAGALALWYTPHMVVHRMARAAQQQDMQAFARQVDFPALRESLKQALQRRMGRGLSDPDNPLSALGAAIASAVVNPLVDTLVQPDNLGLLLAGIEPKVLGNSSHATAPAASGPARPVPQTPAGRDMPRPELHYADINHVHVTVRNRDSGQPTIFVMERRQLLDWKLVAIQWP